MTKAERKRLRTEHKNERKYRDLSERISALKHDLQFLFQHHDYEYRALRRGEIMDKINELEEQREALKAE